MKTHAYADARARVLIVLPAAFAVAALLVVASPARADDPGNVTEELKSLHEADQAERVRKMNADERR